MRVARAEAGLAGDSEPNDVGDREWGGERGFDREAGEWTGIRAFVNESIGCPGDREPEGDPGEGADLPHH